MNDPITLPASSPSAKDFSLVARGHLHPAMQDAGVYLQNVVSGLRGVPFSVQPEGAWMWLLVFEGDLWQLMGQEGTARVCDVARAYITGRGALAHPPNRNEVTECAH